jgi:O-antigen/teichoic acid export membrane protein
MQPEEPRLVDRSFKPALVLTLGRTLAFVVTFLVPVVLVRVFDQSVFGAYKQFFLLYSTFFLIAQAGMAESLFYFLPSFPQKAAAHVSNALFCLTCAGLVCLPILWRAGAPLARSLKDPTLTTDVRFLGLFLAFMLASSLLEIVMISRGQHVRAAWTYGLSDLLRGFLLVLPAVLFRRLDLVFLGAVLFGAARLGATLLYLRREFGGGLGLDREALWGQLAYAVPFGAAVLLETIQGNFHQYAVSYSFDPRTFAIYSIGCLNIPLVDFISGPASNVMMVRMGEALREGRRDEVLGHWHDTVRKVALAFAPLVCGLWLVAHDLIQVLFTKAYLGSVPVFRVWTTLILLTVLMTDGVLRVFADTRFLLALNAVRLLVNVGLIFFFMARFGVVGAVLVTVLASFVARMLALGRIKHHMGVSLAALLPWRSLATTLFAGVAAAGPAVLLGSLFRLSPLERGLLLGVSYGATYLLLVPGLKLLTREEERAVGDWLQAALVKVRGALALSSPGRALEDREG